MGPLLVRVMLRFFSHSLSFAMCIAVCAAGFGPALSAQDSEFPKWQSLRYAEVRMRVGPSQDYPIEWMYKRQGFPVKVIRKREGWSLVVDHEGTQGWIANSQLSKLRGAMVTGEGVTELRAAPSAEGQIRWRAEPGVVGRLGQCQADWCEIDVDGRTGWVLRERLWGTQ